MNESARGRESCGLNGRQNGSVTGMLCETATDFGSSAQNGSASGIESRTGARNCSS